jgi:hypothetical protein
VDGGDGLKMLKVVVNILNNHLQTGDKGWSSSLKVERGLTATRLLHRDLEFDGFFGTT